MRRALLGSLMAAGCSSPGATAADCRVIFERIVALELDEQGVREPAMRSRTAASLAAELEAELGACEGRPLPAGALECVARARSTEELSHGCFRE
jgi:hypothetical protein